MARPVNIAIATAAWLHAGKPSSYVYHLAQGFEAMDAEYRIVSAGTVCAHWMEALVFDNERFIPEADFILAANFRPYFRTLDFARHLLGKIKQSGKPVILSLMDPLEWTWDGAAETIQFLDPIAIVFGNDLHLDLFYRMHRSFAVRSKLYSVPLPYRRFCEGKKPPKDGRAICVTGFTRADRLDRISGLDRINFYGPAKGELSLYEQLYFKGSIRENLKGYVDGFDYSKEALDQTYGPASSLVNMTEDPGCGAWDKYIFLEAMDYGLALICPDDWEILGDLMPGIHYHSASNPSDIKTAIAGFEKHNPFSTEQFRLLEKHRADRIAGEILSIWKEKRRS